MIHETPSPLARKTVIIQSGKYKGESYWIEDWWDRVNGGVSWGNSVGNPACIKYAIRLSGTQIPLNNEVLYGKIGFFGELIHLSELLDESGNVIEAGGRV